MLGEQDAQVEEQFGQVSVGAVGDVEGLGELPAGPVGDERGEDRYGPVLGRYAKLGQGGGQDAGMPGAAPVGAVDRDRARVVEFPFGGQQVTLLDRPDGGVGVLPPSTINVDEL